MVFKILPKKKKKKFREQNFTLFIGVEKRQKISEEDKEKDLFDYAI